MIGQYLWRRLSDSSRSNVPTRLFVYLVSSNAVAADFASSEVYALLERSSPRPEAIQSPAKLELRPQGGTFTYMGTLCLIDIRSLTASTCLHMLHTPSDCSWLRVDVQCFTPRPLQGSASPPHHAPCSGIRSGCSVLWIMLHRSRCTGSSRHEATLPERPRVESPGNETCDVCSSLHIYLDEIRWVPGGNRSAPLNCVRRCAT